jgi:hypothetical protein
MGTGGFIGGRAALLAVVLEGCAHEPVVAPREEMPAALERGDPRFFRWPVRQLRYFVPEPGCAQGPFQIRVAAAESRWGQQLELWAYTPHPLKGNVQITFHPGETSRDSFGSGPLRNEHCVLAAEEIVPGPAGGPVIGGGGAGGTKGAGASIPPPARPVVLHEIPRPAIPPAGERQYVKTFELDSDGHRPYPRTFVTYRIWFDEPVDLTGVVFVTGLYVGELLVPEAQFFGHQRAEEARARAEEVRYRAEQARRDEEARRKEAERSSFCNNHPQDTDCWGPGGLPGHLARQEQARRDEMARLERERQEELARLERERRYPFLRPLPTPPTLPRLS